MLKKNIIQTLFISFQSILLIQNAYARTQEIKSQTMYLGTKSAEEYKNWHFKNPHIDNIAGISLENIYQNYTAQKVIVAVIDSGFDISHEQFKSQLWINKNEIPNNNIDDDGNGYIDDIVGWNFLGKSSVSAKILVNQDDVKVLPLDIFDHITFDSYESVRVLKSLKEQESLDAEESELMKELENEVTEKRNRAQKLANQYQEELDKFTEAALSLGFTSPKEITLDKIENIQTTNVKETLAKNYLKNTISNGENYNYLKYQNIQYRIQVDYHYNLNLNEREKIIQDNPDTLLEKGYGNNDVTGFHKEHGTHVAGIVSSEIKHLKLQDQIKLMLIKAIPNGDERDKDVINAIYYAVDNGAQVINMSFGKTFSPDNIEVSKALEYAQKHDVVVIKSAGNSYLNLNQTNTFPSAYINNERLPNTLVVAASAPDIDETLLASFSNYGNETVDLMAPGVDIYSSLPGNKYGLMSGTSMAAPVVSGLAAILKSLDLQISASELLQNLKEQSDNYSGAEVYHSAEGTRPIEEFLINPVIPNFLKLFEGLFRSNSVAMN